MDLEILESLQRLDLKPGDVLVAKTDYQLTSEQVERIKAAWDAVAKGTSLEAVPMIVLHGGIDLAALRAEV